MTKVFFLCHYIVLYGILCSMIFISHRNFAHSLLSCAYNIHCNFQKVVIKRFLTFFLNCPGKKTSPWEVFLKSFFTCIFSTAVCLPGDFFQKKVHQVAFGPRWEAPKLSESLLVIPGGMECMLQLFVKSLSKLFYVVLKENWKTYFLSV